MARIQLNIRPQLLCMVFQPSKYELISCHYWSLSITTKNVRKESRVMKWVNWETAFKFSSSIFLEHVAICLQRFTLLVRIHVISKALFHISSLIPGMRETMQVTRNKFYLEWNQSDCWKCKCNSVVLHLFAAKKNHNFYKSINMYCHMMKIFWIYSVHVFFISNRNFENRLGHAYGKSLFRLKYASILLIH